MPLPTPVISGAPSKWPRPAACATAASRARFIARGRIAVEQLAAAAALSSTKRRIALDRLPPRSASIADNSALTDRCRRAASSHSACQNAVSRDTLVACPAIRTECLTNDALIVSAQRCQAAEFFQALGWHPLPRSTGCLKERRQSATIPLRPGAMPAFAPASATAATIRCRMPSLMSLIGQLRSIGVSAGCA
jgi:hypothetical protein